MTTTSLIGALASLASMTGLVPQAWKIYKARHARDISGAAFAILVTAYALWTVYGLLLTDWPLIVTNVVCLVLAGFILTVKIRTSGTVEGDSR